VTKWQGLFQEAQKQENDPENFVGLTDFEKKQKEVDLTHGSSVTKIKREIYDDRQNFLQKLISLQSETPATSIKAAQDTPTKDVAPEKPTKEKEEKLEATKKVPKAEEKNIMSLSQESHKTKLDEMLEADAEKKSQKDSTDTTTPKVKKAGKLLKFDFKKAKKDKKAKAEAKALVSKGDIEQDK